MKYSPLILEYFASEDAAPIRPKQLAQELGVGKKSLRAFLESLEGLVNRGELHLSTNGLLRKKSREHLLAGIVRRSPSGTGSFVPKDEVGSPDLQPISIYPEDMGSALTGDEVLVQVLKRRRSDGQRCGRVREVVARARNTFVGTYQEQRDKAYVILDGGLMDHPVSVGDPGAKGAQPNDKVVVEMLHFPSWDEMGEAVITQVLGPHGSVGVDTLSVIYQFGLRDEFPPAVQDEARLVAQQFDENNLSDRLDLTGDTIITIDPVDARDFDDAISLTREAHKGHWRLGVHIADVAHFVKPGSQLDHEAQIRGNSVYLPDRVLPMLPELLSNALASLQQGKVRFTKTVFIEFTPEGIPVHTEFANSAICVKQRFAYEQVLPVLEQPEAHAETVSADVQELLGRMQTLARILRKRRFANGALDLAVPEVKIDLSKQGHVAGAHQVQHDESHQIIEEFMLAANIAVARRLDELGLPFLRRTHAAPDERKLKRLSEFMKTLGFEIREFPGRQDLQELVNQARGTPYEQAVSFAVLRSLKQAEYSPLEIEHYALAEVDYCHFTSPIRRYPDLTIHRLFEDIARGRPPKAPHADDLLVLGRNCSQTERTADQAERELIKVKLLNYLSSRIGMELEGIVTGVEKFGLFCMGVELPAEGLIPLKSLPNDHYDYDSQAHVLVARRSGLVWRLGDRLKVRVAEVDLQKRMLSYRVVARLSGTSQPPGKGPKTGDSKKLGKKSKTETKSGRKGKKKRS